MKRQTSDIRRNSSFDWLRRWTIFLILIIVGSSCLLGTSYVLADDDDDANCRDRKIGKIMTTGFFTGEIEEYFYVKNSSKVFLRDAGQQVFWSEDDGLTFKKLDALNSTIRLVAHAYVKNRLYALGLNETAFYSSDGGKTFKSIRLPAIPHFLGGPVLFFSEVDPERILFRGIVSCERHPCKTRMFYTIDHGHNWTALARDSMESCLWLLSEGVHHDGGTKDSALCIERFPTNNRGETSRLVRSDDRFLTFRTVLDKPANAFRIFGGFILVAVEIANPVPELTLYVSSDGQTFNKVVFPSEAEMKPQAFTVLESTTFSIFMANALDGPFGHLYASNSNGTRFSTLLKYIHQDARRITDYERVPGLEGVILVNVVRNPSSSIFGTKAELETLVTFNDGGTWDSLRAPDKDLTGQPYECNDKVSFFERFDPDLRQKTRTKMIRLFHVGFYHVFMYIPVSVFISTYMLVCMRVHVPCSQSTR
jgi:hypothetical protein